MFSAAGGGFGAPAGGGFGAPAGGGFGAGSPTNKKPASRPAKLPHLAAKRRCFQVFARWRAHAPQTRIMLPNTVGRSSVLTPTLPVSSGDNAGRGSARDGGDGRPAGGAGLATGAEA